MKIQEVKPPDELFIEEHQMNGSGSSMCCAYSSREVLAAARIQHHAFDWLEKKDPDAEQVFVYKFSHVEILRKKLEIIIEKPKANK